MSRYSPFERLRGAAGLRGGGDSAEFLPLERDRDRYVPGDRARMLVPIPAGAGAFVTVESPSAVLDAFWLAGPTASDAIQTIELDVTMAMVPNVSVIQANGTVGNDRPLQVYGVVPLFVEDPHSNQAIVITVPGELRPGEDFDVAVQTSDGEPTQFVVAVADEGLLDLTAFRTLDPHAHFFRKQRVGARPFDSYSHVIAPELASGRYELVDSDGAQQTSRFEVLTTS